MRNLIEDFNSFRNYFIAFLLLVLVGVVAFYSANIQEYVHPQTYRIYTRDLEKRVRYSMQKRFMDQGISVKRFYINYKRGYDDWLSGTVHTYGKITSFTAVLITQEPTGEHVYDVNIAVDGKDVEWTIATELNAEAIATQTVKTDTDIATESLQLSK